MLYVLIKIQQSTSYMRIFKSHPLLKLVNSYLIDSPQPSNLSYLWNFGSLLGFCLVIQIVTGVTLAMHYTPSALEAFNSIEHIMRDVNNGWLIRYLHSNTASAFFFLVYLHIGRGLYYGSYRAPRTLVWVLGTVIFLLMIITAFLGYVLPYGQMSLWGATVITNFVSAVPWIGQDIVEFIWGGFSVNNATLNRFFALHFVLPFILAALVLMHLIALHESAGSGNPLGISGNYDRIPFAPYFIFKDLITIFIFIVVLSVFVFFMPNVLGDSENYVMANPMQTPPSIVPEWYLLPFYAILRSIPNKLLGVIAMLSAILIILAMPYTDLSRSRGIQFRPLSKIAFYIFVANFLILTVLGAKHVETPFIELGQISTVLYFSHYLIIVPLISLLENSLIELSIANNNNVNKEYTVLRCGSGSLLTAIVVQGTAYTYVIVRGIVYAVPVVASVYLLHTDHGSATVLLREWHTVIDVLLPRYQELADAAFDLADSISSMEWQRTQDDNGWDGDPEFNALESRYQAMYQRAQDAFTSLRDIEIRIMGLDSDYVPTPNRLAFSEPEGFRPFAGRL